MPKVKVDLDNLPKDAEVEIPYLGLFKNGTTTDVAEIKWNRYLEHFPGANDNLGGDTLEVSTKKARESSRALLEARRAARAERGRSPAPPVPVANTGEGDNGGQGSNGSEGGSEGGQDVVPLSKRNKDDLVELAEARGHDTSGKNKDELIELLSQEG